MSGRNQYVNIDRYYSSTKDITLGVPQDSILGPVLFLVFINDLLSALQSTLADMHATTISYSTDYKLAPKALSDGLQSDLDRLQKCSDSNKLILNKTKTKAMLATGKWIKKRMRNLASHVKLNANELGHVNSQKLLSVKMDQNLSFDDHIDGLCKTLSQ